MKQLGIILTFAVLSIALVSFTVDQNKKWVVPAKDKAMKNPVASSADNLKDGKMLFMQHCKSCHGTKGLGDGPKAKNMNGDLGDFSSKDFQAQTDGELFYRTKTGNGDMPAFGKKMSDDDVWTVVNYMRSLK